MVLMYGVVALIALAALGSLAVDYGHVVVVRSELQNAADAAALFAAKGMETSPAKARDNARDSATQNKSGSAFINFNRNDDVEFGVWNPTTRTFTVSSAGTEKSATAVRVTLRRTAERGNAVPMTLAAIIGKRTADVTATAIATRGRVFTPSVPAPSCPWLAGMPAGSNVPRTDGNSKDSFAPFCSPEAVTDLPITAGATLRFRETNGVTGDPDNGTFGLDGRETFIANQPTTNNIGGCKAPIGALIGIFLDDRVPTAYAAASATDFSSASSRNATQMKPKLKEVFFIGDGINDKDDLQEFIVPTGATRLYLAVMDEKGWWWDNYGQIDTTILDNKIQLVR